MSILHHRQLRAADTMDKNYYTKMKSELPDTPYFRAQSDHIAYEARTDLDLLCSGGEGYYFTNGFYPVNLYYNYGMLLGDAVSVSMAYLGKKTRATIGEILRYLGPICELGLLRRDCIDKDARVLYLTKAAASLNYVEYALDDRGREVILDRPQEIQDALYDEIISNDIPDVTVPENKMDTETNGDETFAQLVRRYNDALPDPEITAVLDETERLLVLLSDTVKNMPAQNKKLHNVTAKYLPQLEALLQTYQSFYPGDSDDQRFRSIRSLIIDAVHMFNNALRQLTNDLLSDAELEISGEIARLKIMLERDGLLKSAFTLS